MGLAIDIIREIELLTIKIAVNVDYTTYYSFYNVKSLCN